MRSALVALAVLSAFAELHAASFLSPCDVPGVREKAQCGTYEVWENREAKSGRRIGLKVIVLPATESPREADALTYLAGGPGEAATHIAPYARQVLGDAQKHRDIVLVDQRGTGASHALECDLYPGKDAQAALGAFFPAERVRQCKAADEKTADLRMYTTANAVDDLDEIRGALGYERLDLFGGSYGTRASLEFIRRHPDHVRVAVLQGVVSPSELMPMRFPRSAQQAIETIFADCQADADCHKAFPDLNSELKAIVARTSAKAVPVDIVDSKTGDTVHVSLSRNLLGEALRYLMYVSATGLYVPVLVHQAAGGDFTPLAEFALGTRRQLVNGVGQGLYLSVTCSEDLPFIKPAEAERIAANTFLGDYRYRQQQAACEAWARGPVPNNAHDPVRAETPVLLFSGSWDPVTPASNAKEVAATLPQSLSVVIPAGGHDYDGLPGAERCVASIMNAFVGRGGTKGVDTSCAAALHRAPFPTTPVETKSVSLSNEQMDALIGQYAGEGAPPLDLVNDHGKMRAVLRGTPESFFVVPVSPTRLRVLGDIGTYLAFDMQNGKAAGVALERAGTRSLTWKRAGPSS